VQCLPGRGTATIYDPFAAGVAGDPEDVLARLGSLESKVVELDDRIILLESGSKPPVPPPDQILPRIEVLERNFQTLDQRVRAIESTIPQLRR
jgi:hypothetical protein